MKLHKFRWSKVYESNEEELVNFLQARDIQTTHNILAEFASTQEPQKDAETTLWCAEGSFGLICNATTYSMQPGDAIRIPINTTVDINAGISGCIYYVS